MRRAPSATTSHYLSAGLLAVTLAAGLCLPGQNLAADTSGASAAAPVAPRWAHTAGVNAPAAKARATNSRWRKRHALIKSRARAAADANRQVDVLLLGDSITEGWESWRPWSRRFGDYEVVNAGIASDRVEHILWRTEDGLLDRIRPRVIVIMAGVNNMALHSPAQIAAVHARLISHTLARSPQSKILLIGVLPTGRLPDCKARRKVAAINTALAGLADDPQVRYIDIGGRFVERDGTISRRIMSDYLHPTAAGYERYAAALEPHLKELLGLSLAGR